MIGIRRLLVCAAVASALVVPSLALASSSTSSPWTLPASNSSPRYEHFVAWVSGSQITTWKQPTRSQGDCSYHYTVTPQGREVVKFRSTKIKVLAIDYGSDVMFQYGSWYPYSFSRHYWPANGTTQRQDLTTSSWTAGPCAPLAIPPVSPKEDCNPTRVRQWNLQLEYSPTDQTLGLLFIPRYLGHLGVRGKDFVNCPIETTGHAEADTISDASVSFPVKDIFGGYGKQIAIAQKTWSTKPPAAPIRTTVRWTLTLVRYP